MENFKETETNINGEEGAVSVETNVTTAFVDAGSEQKLSMKIGPRQDIMPSEDQSIDAFMARPYLVTNYSWTASDTFGQDIFHVIVDDYIDGSVGGYFRDKIEGFQLCRGTAVLRLVLNAQPFQSGRLLIHYTPLYGRWPSGWLQRMNRNMIQKSQHPCIEMDARDSVVELEMDFIAPENWYSQNSTGAYWGRFSVSVLSPLQAGTGATGAELSAYIYFKNFELAAPAPQMRNTNKMKGSKLAKSEGILASTGTLSQALASTSSIASSMSVVPNLAAVCKPVAWAADVAAGLASSYGYSKPHEEETTTPINIQTLKYAATSNGANPSYQIAIDARNELTRLPDVTLRTEDEMSFDFLKKVNSYFYTWTWSNQAVGDIIGNSLALGPRNFFNVETQVITSHTVTMQHCVPFSYMSNFFELYRGSIEITFKIPKTDFHTGRLQITYTPSNTGFVSPTLVSSYYSMREIIDISGGDEFTYRFPWMSAQNYLTTNTAYGTIELKVLNPLKYPSTASSSLDILVFARAADDFELQLPRIQHSPDTTSGAFSMPFQPQMRGSIVDTTIAGEGNAPLLVTMAQQCIGESFTSVKQLINRTSLQLFGINNSDGCTIWPWYCPLPNQNSTTGVLNTSMAVPDAFVVFAPMFMFYRGGAELTLNNGTYNLKTGGMGTFLDTCPPATSAALSTNVFPGGTVATGQGLQPCSGYSFTEGNNNVIHVPYFAECKMSMLCPELGNSTSIYRSLTLPQPRSRLAVNWTGTSVAPALARSFSDDFQLSMFYACPPLIVGFI